MISHPHRRRLRRFVYYHKRGAQVHELADAYGVSRQAVWKIVTRRTHKRVLDLPDGTDLPNLRRLQTRRHAASAADAPPRPTPPADPPPLPIAPPRPTTADLEADAQAQEVQRREDAARKQAEKLAKARLHTGSARFCQGHSCTLLCPIVKCHGETEACDERDAASANCDGGKYCHCRCHSGEMPKIVLDLRTCKPPC